MSFASRREGEGVELEEGEGSGLLAGQGRWRFKHLIQFETCPLEVFLARPVSV